VDGSLEARRAVVAVSHLPQLSSLAGQRFAVIESAVKPRRHRNRRTVIRRERRVAGRQHGSSAATMTVGAAGFAVESTGTNRTMSQWAGLIEASQRPW